MPDHLKFNSAPKPPHPDAEGFVAGRVFCIGKNYALHVKELSGSIPESPVVFMKPASSLVLPGELLNRPTHGQDLHHEIEVVLLIGKSGKDIAEAEAPDHIAGVTLGIDLTLRDVQTSLKKKGHPWEASKAFDASAPIGHFVPVAQAGDLNDLEFSLKVNGEIRQQGNTRNMLFPIPRLIAHLSSIWQLHAGDVIFTGTPEGVGPIPTPAQLIAESVALGCFDWIMD